MGVTNKRANLAQLAKKGNPMDMEWSSTSSSNKKLEKQELASKGDSVKTVSKNDIKAVSAKTDGGSKVIVGKNDIVVGKPPVGLDGMNSGAPGGVDVKQQQERKNSMSASNPLAALANAPLFAMAATTTTSTTSTNSKTPLVTTTVTSVVTTATVQAAHTNSFSYSYENFVNESLKQRASKEGLESPPPDGSQAGQRKRTK